jgi:hypothetical protein
MKYQSIDQSLFVQNRQKFMAQMQPNTIAIFRSNYEYTRNGDATMDFKQHSDFFWLMNSSFSKNNLAYLISSQEERNNLTSLGVYCISESTKLTEIKSENYRNRLNHFKTPIFIHDRKNKNIQF